MNSRLPPHHMQRSDHASQADPGDLSLKAAEPSNHYAPLDTNRNSPSHNLARPIQLEIGDVFIGADGSRSMVLGFSPSEILLDEISVNIATLSPSGNVTASRIEFSEIMETHAIESVERNAAPKLVPGSLIPTSLAGKDLQALRMGDVVTSHTGDLRIEVLGNSFISKGSTGDAEVPLLVYHPDGDITLLRCKVTDIIPIDNILDLFEQGPNLFLPPPSHALSHEHEVSKEAYLQRARGFFSHIESLLARRASAALDDLIQNADEKNYKNIAPYDMPPVAIARESYLSQLKQLHRQSDTLARAFLNLNQYAHLFGNAQITEQPLQARRGGENEEILGALSSIDAEAARLSRQLEQNDSQEAKDAVDLTHALLAEYHNFVGEVLVFIKTVRFNTLRNMVALPEEAGRYRRTSAEDLMNDLSVLSAKLAGIAEEVVKELGDPTFRTRGGFLHAESSEEFESLLQLSGAHVLSYYETDHSGCVEELKGYLIYFEPGHEHWFNRGIDKVHAAPCAYVYELAIAPDAAPGSARMLLDALLIDLQRTDAQFHAGRILINNTASLKLQLENGGLLNLDDEIITVNRNGRQAHWVGMSSPVDPEVRSRLWSLRPKVAARNLQILQRIEELGSDSPISELTAARDKKGLSRDEFIAQLKNAPNQDCIIALTGGCGNTAAGQWQGLSSMFIEAFEGFNGALLFGASEMKAVVDGKTTAKVKTDICQLPERCVDLSKGAVLGGIMYDPGGLEDTAHGRVLSTSDPKFVTVLKDSLPFYRRVQEDTSGGTSQWDIEYHERAEIIEQLNPAKRLLIAYHGGGTTRREIRYWIERGWDIALIPTIGVAEGKTRGSAQAFIDDQGWLDEYTGKFHVVRSGKELRAVLEAYGAISDDANPGPDFSNLEHGVSLDRS